MSLAHAMPAIPSSCTHCRIVNKNSDNTSSSSNFDYGCNYSQDEHKVWVWGIPKVTTMSSAIGIARVLTVPLSRARKFDILNGRWRLNAVDTHIVQNAPTRSTVEIPVTCHQVILLKFLCQAVTVYFCIDVVKCSCDVRYLFEFSFVLCINWLTVEFLSVRINCWLESCNSHV